MRRFVVVLLLAALAGVAWAAGYPESYQAMRLPPVQYARFLDGASATTLSAPVGDVAGVTTYAVSTRSNPTVAVRVGFSGSSGDTQSITCVLWYLSGGSWTLVGTQTATATAGGFTDANDDNVAPILWFDTSGAPFYELRWGAPSAGLTRITSWSYGADSR